MHERLCCGTFDKVSLLLIVHLVLSNYWFGSDLDSGSYCIEQSRATLLGYTPVESAHSGLLCKKKKKSICTTVYHAKYKYSCVTHFITSEVG